MGGQTSNAIGTVGANHPLANGASTQQPSSSWPTNAIDWARFIHRLLRGRYRRALIVVLAYAALGGLGGWLLTPTLYRSDGMVHIASSLPAVIQETDQTRAIPMFDSFMQAQQEMVVSGTVMEEALKDPAWSAPAISGRRPSVEEMANQLKVEVKPKSENLRISYIDANPSFASTAVASTIAAYRKIYDRDHLKLEQQRLQLLQDYRGSLMGQLGLSDATTRPTTQPTGTEAAASTPTTQPFAGPVVALPLAPSPEIIAMSDQGMRHLLDDQDQVQDELDQATLIYGPRHEAVARLKLELDATSRRIDQYLQDYFIVHSTAAAVVQGASTDGVPSTQPVMQAQSSIMAAQPAAPTAAMQQLQSQLEDVNHRIEILKAENNMPKRFEVVSMGQLAVPVEDKRIKVSAMSAGVLGFVACILMIASGLIRRKYNFCAEITEDFSQRTPFVAVIPELGAGNNAQGSDDAAQCIHHLREAIKQSAKVYAFTSADAGEGCTSVVLSLALSFAATGMRTLVIDADFLSRGITKKLKLESAPGFFRAMSTGNIVDSLHLSRGGVTIMSIGHTLGGEVMSIEEPALIGLLDKLRERFDAILIDAGSMSYADTCVVARQAEGIVLIVGRGQEQSLVRSGLTELERLKLNVLGTVFNRAETNDFYRSIQRKQIAATVSEPGEVSEALVSCGPLVQAVALSLRKDITIMSASEIAATQLQAA